MATSMNISLPKELRDFVVRETARGGYGSASEFVREILRGEAKRRARETLEQKLLAGLSGPRTVLTDSDWERWIAKYGRPLPRKRK